MSQLAIVLQTGFAHSFEDFRTRIHKMADQLTELFSCSLIQLLARLVDAFSTSLLAASLAEVS